MSKIVNITLASAMLIAGSSMAFSADHGMNGRDPNFDGNGRIGTGFPDKSRSSEQLQKLELDYGTTGSITGCRTQLYDEYGNCVIDRGYQPMR